jgi:hypothetical protein
MIANKRPTRLGGNLAAVLGEMLEIAVPFASANRQFVDSFEFLWAGVDKTPDISAQDFLSRPAVHKFSSLVPKLNFAL